MNKTKLLLATAIASLAFGVQGAMADNSVEGGGVPVCNTPGSNGSTGIPKWTVNQQTGCGNLDYDTTPDRASLENYTTYIGNHPAWTLGSGKPAPGDPSTCMAAISPYNGTSRSDNSFINAVKRSLGTLTNKKKWSNLKPDVIGAGSWVGFGGWADYSKTTCGTCLKLTCDDSPPVSVYAIAVDSNSLTATRFMDTQDTALVEALGCKAPSAENACDSMKCSWEVVDDTNCYVNPPL
jgi:hypothetical protein